MRSIIVVAAGAAVVRNPVGPITTMMRAMVAPLMGRLIATVVATMFVTFLAVAGFGVRCCHTKEHQGGNENCKEAFHRFV
ncbi:MAG: hypothetical protein ACR2OZ_13905 [Verrucomicrobiales bacterium]